MSYMQGQRHSGGARNNERETTDGLSGVTIASVILKYID
jgi:hypothetical protein